MKLSEIGSILQVEIPQALAEIVPQGFSIDTRTLRKGELFFAIKGENFDGHKFVANALAQGACAAVVSQPMTDLDNQHLITATDTLLALQQLAEQLLKNWGRPIVGITGSAGKTTTKELTALVLEKKGRVLKSTGNLNNAYGLPLSVLRMETDGASAAEFDYAVLEMGMSTPGEIRRLCEIAPPDVGAVLNVSAVHLEFFESLDGIANAKAELVEGLKPTGLAILNADDSRVQAMHTRHKGPVKFFGLGANADIRAAEIRPNGLLGTNFRLITSQASVEAHLPLAGRHILYNALVAAAVGDYFGLTAAEIVEQLQKARPATHRGEILRFKAGFVVVDDSYNSNPRALDEMVTMLVQAQGVTRRIVVAGEMLELGATSDEMHRACGQHIAQAGVDLLVGVRGLAQEIIAGASVAGFNGESYFANDSQNAANWLVDQLKAGDLVLVKGSRGVKTDLIIDVLKQKFELEAQ